MSLTIDFPPALADLVSHSREKESAGSLHPQNPIYARHEFLRALFVLVVLGFVFSRAQDRPLYAELKEAHRS